MSNPTIRKQLVRRLDVLAATEQLPIRAASRADLAAKLGGGISPTACVLALRSLHFKDQQVLLRRTGDCWEPDSRGWLLDLPR